MVSKVSALADAGPEPQLTPAPVISVENLVHRYEHRTALNGVSFDVRPAELFGLLGPNGSGKTTLFRILSTLMIPTSGRAVVMGCGLVVQMSPSISVCSHSCLDAKSGLHAGFANRPIAKAYR